MLKIGELAEAVGTTTRTLRHYEELGLIKPIEVTEAGYRIYSKSQIPVVKRIHDLQRVGLSLDEIKELIGLYFTENQKIDAKKKTLKYLEDHYMEIEQKIQILNNMRHEIMDQIYIYRQRLEKLSHEKK